MRLEKNGTKDDFCRNIYGKIRRFEVEENWIEGIFRGFTQE